MPGSAERDPEQERLIAAFLKMWEGLSNTAVAELHTYITDSDVSRWRRDDWQRINDPRKILEMKRKIGETPSPGMVESVRSRYGEEAADVGLSGGESA